MLRGNIDYFFFFLENITKTITTNQYFYILNIPWIKSVYLRS